MCYNQDLSPSWCPEALYSGHNMAARPRPNMNSNSMKYMNTASPNHNNPNGHEMPRLSNRLKPPMNPSFSILDIQDQFRPQAKAKSPQKICAKFNKFRKAHCELHNACYYNRLHKC